MPDLEQTLQGHDLGFLKIVASAWGMELSAPDTVTALPIVSRGITEHADFGDVIAALPEDAKTVLQVLVQNEGRLPWALFVRKYGDVRRMGAARRDRERPDRKPGSAAEVLWYRSLIGRAFLSIPPETEPQEFVYIPDDILPLLPTLHGDSPPPLGRPATPNESAHPVLANDFILDHACTLLAALRLKFNETTLTSLNLGGIPKEFLRGLLSAARLLDYDGLPHPDGTRSFLAAPRGQALAQLVQSWMEDPHLNELRLLPGLRFEGEWSNDSLRARSTVLEMVSQIPENRWWSLPAFIAAVKENHPDFQRPGGDYDSWFIRQANSGNYLRGFSAWDDVDGALLRFIITGPMHWLGLVDLASSEPVQESGLLHSFPPTALRLSRWAAPLWHGEAPERMPTEDARLKVLPDGQLTVPALIPRAVRYQVARFCQWGSVRQKEGHFEYAYQITPTALERAKGQGLRASQLTSLLRRHCEGALSPTLIQALDHWETSGTQAALEKVVLLRVNAPEIIAALRKTRAARCLGETLNETTVLIRPGMETQVMSALVDIGYLGDSKIEPAAE
jgi:hypothetical protein